MGATIQRMCCGGGSAAARQRALQQNQVLARSAGRGETLSPAFASRGLIGSVNGMVTLRYVGGNVGKQTIQVTQSRNQYRYSGREGKREISVDAGDVRFLLETGEFEIVKSDSEPETQVENPEGTEEVAGKKGATVSHTEWAATRTALAELRKYGLTLDDVQGTGKDGRILKSDVVEYVAGLPVEATDQAIALAEENGLDIKMFIHKVQGKIGKADVTKYLDEVKAGLANLDAEIDAEFFGADDEGELA